MFDSLIKWLCWISVILLFVELELGSDNSLSSDTVYFLWAERFIASIFMVDYFYRFVTSVRSYKEKGNSWWEDDYPTSALGVIDLISWLPFIVGFFVPIQFLGIIRALRVLRLGKFLRYSPNLRVVLEGFKRSWPMLKALLFTMFVVCMFAAVVMYEVEKDFHEDFSSFHDVVWFTIVSATTVGYGDMSPITPLGKLCSIVLLFGPAIFVFSGIVGVAGGSIQAALQAVTEKE